LAEMKKVFNSFDADGSGMIDADELTLALKNMKLDASADVVKSLIAEVDKDGNNQIDFGEFADIVANMKAGKTSSDKGFARIYSKQKELVQVKGHTGTHSYSEEEMSAFAEHINHCLGSDPECKYLLPIETKGLDLCAKVRDGVLLSKFINYAVQGTIDERALNIPKGGKALSLFQINENQTLCINAAKSIGVQTVNIGASELIDGEKHPHLVLGVAWQLVKISLLNSINLKNHPELIRLLESGEELSDLLRLPPDQLLLRWVNYHLKNAGHPKKITNFSGDVKDSVAYTVLLSQIAPGRCDRSALSSDDLTVRANKVLSNAQSLDVKCFIKAGDIVAGNPRLNLAFTAAIFNQCPGLDPLTEEELEKAGIMDDDFGDSREERAFRMWINSLGIDGVYVNNLFEDCKDGLVLLKLMDKIHPGIVSWKQVEKNPSNKFKKVSNCNYVIVLGKQLKFSLVNVGGSDIVDGNRKLLLAFVWQLMRYHTIRFLAEVQAKKFGGAEVTDDMIIAWCNDKVKSAGRTSTMANFKDKTLRSGLFFLDLLAAIEPRIIDAAFVTPGETDEDALNNARYCISVARKLGATIFLLPEDIVEVQPKMIMTLASSIMGIAP